MTRLMFLAGACALLWILETRRPLVALGEERRQHVGANLALAVLTVLTNLGFTLALRPWGSSTGKGSHPFWLEAFIGVVCLDFMAWVAHVLLHKTAWGWRTHRVHHSDVAVDVTTALRQHPAETVWRLLWRAAPAAALGITVPVVALYELLSVANALLEHANLAVPGKLDRRLRWALVTPTMHKWHHSRDPRETDTNYGNIFSVWDRVFGTFTNEPQLARLRYGLDGDDGPEARSFSGLLRMPLRR